MKKSVQITILVGLTGLLFSLNSCESPNPDDVVHQFVQYWYKGELEEAKGLVTPESIPVIENLSKLRTEEDILKLNSTVVECTIEEVDHINDSTKVYHCLLYLNNKQKRATFSLKRIDENWFVKL